MTDHEIQLRRETNAAKLLVASLRAEFGDDAELLTNAVEGETALLEAIDAALAEIDEAEVLVVGLKDKENQFAGRRRALEERIKRFRTMIEQAMAVSEQVSMRRSTATLTLRNLPVDVVVLAEADIPAEFFVPQPPPPPKLDKAVLRLALQDRAREVESASAITDVVERQRALAALAPIPGATLNNGGFSLQIRRS